MKLKTIDFIETPYTNLNDDDYPTEKRRLQLELLKIQQRIIKHKKRLVIIFEGRDAAGKGATIKRFSENLIPAHFAVHEIGIPSPKESRFWFRRYESRFPEPENMAFSIDLGIPAH